jgi:hypothetical protein
MNNLKAVLIVGILILLNSMLNAQVVTGNAKLEKASHESLTVAGSLEFDKLTIEQTLSVSGSAKGNSLKCNVLNVNGSFKGENIQAKNGEVNGKMSCKELTIGEDLIVKGRLSGQKIKVSGKTSVDGNIVASESSFGDIELGTTGNKDTYEIVLLDSKAKNILFKQTKSESQRIYLEGKTIIEGDITFESNNGKVIFSMEAKVKGKIHGATIVNGFGKVGVN